MSLESDGGMILTGENRRETCPSATLSTTNPTWIDPGTKAQVVSRRPLTTEAPVRAVVNPCGMFGGQSDTGTGVSPSSSVSPDNIVPPSLFIFGYHVGDEQ
jgi:hypothetical protein